MGERSNSDPADQSSQEKSPAENPGKDRGRPDLDARTHSLRPRQGGRPTSALLASRAFLAESSHRPALSSSVVSISDRSPGRLQRVGRNRASGNGNANRLRPNPCAGTPTSMLFLSALKRGAGRRNLGNDGRGLVS